MIEKAMDVLSAFPVRRKKQQKAAFRQEIQSYAQKLGYTVAVEKTSFGGTNVVFGDPKTAKYLVTAHYDTPGTIGIPNFITPCNALVFTLYQILLIGALVVFSIFCGVAAALALKVPKRIMASRNQ